MQLQYVMVVWYEHVMLIEYEALAGQEFPAAECIVPVCCDLRQWFGSYASFNFRRAY